MSIGRGMVNEITVQLHYVILCNPPRESRSEFMHVCQGPHEALDVHRLIKSHNNPMKFPFYR